MTQPETIFDCLKAQLKDAYGKKDMKTGWGWSVCGTPIQIGATLIMGINWGGGSISDQHEYKFQDRMPDFDKFKQDYEKGDYKFLKRISPLIKEYCHLDISEGKFNYSNLCFFRTPGIKNLTDDDYKSSIPIFKSLIELVKPSQIISLGTGNISRLQKYFPDDFQTGTAVLVPDTSHRIYSGFLFGYKFYGLPHPGARKLSNETYERLWKALFKI
jgi:hypothetical protein